MHPLLPALLLVPQSQGVPAPELSGVILHPTSASLGRPGGPGTGPLNVGTNLRMNTDATTNNQNETSVAINPTNFRNFVGGANDYRTGNVKCGWYTSTDGGRTSAADGVFTLQPGWPTSGDPIVGCDAQGRFYFLDLNFSTSGGVTGALYVHRSIDGGLTWPTTSQAFRITGNLPDKPNLAVDQRLAGAFAGSLYATFTGFSAAPLGIQCIFSRDQGATWSGAVALPASGGQGSSPAVGPNGEVYVAWHESIGRIAFAASANGAVSFGPVRTVSTITTNPSPMTPASFRANSFPTCAVDNSQSPFRGRVYVSWSSRAAGSSEIFCARSTDGGTTWSAPVRVNDVLTADQFFQWMTVDESGTVFASWFDRRNDPLNRGYDIYASASYDGGVTWIPNWKVSTALSNPGTQSFIGDYSGICAGGGVAYPLWTDLRLGNQDVFVAPVQADLECSPTAVSALLGGNVQLPIKAGPVHAGDVYVLVAGCSGTTPGVPLAPGVHLNVNYDLCTELSLLGANVPPHVNSVGILGAGGLPPVQPRYLAPPGFLGFLANGDLSFAFVLVTPAAVLTYGSNPVTVHINP